MATKLGQLPAAYDLALYAGDDFRLNLALADPAADLTGYTARAQIRATPDAPDILAEWDCTLTGGSVVLHLAGADSARLPATCAWDVEVIDPDGETTTLAYGRITVTPEVTR